MPQQLTLQDATCLDKQSLVDRLVGYTHRRLLRESAGKPSCDLLGRPVESQLLGDETPEARMLSQLARLRPQAPGPRLGMRVGRPISIAASVTSNLPRHR